MLGDCNLVNDQLLNAQKKPNKKRLHFSATKIPYYCRE